MSPEARRRAAVALLCCGLVAGVALVGRGSIRGRADFAFCNQQEIASLDPAIATGVPEGRILRALFEGLTRAGPHGAEPLPGMARSWTTSADGLVWRFELRSDSAWTNGETVTAHDFAYSFARTLHPSTAAPYAYLLWVIEGGEAYTTAPQRGQLPDPASLGIQVPAPTELVLTLSRPCPHLPRLLAYHPFLPVHEGCLTVHGPAWIRPGNIVTNGPFRLAARRVRDRIRLQRHEGYWGREQVSLATVDAYATEGATAQLNLYLTGEVDWMIRPPASLYDVLLDRPDARRGPQAGVSFFRFNTRREPLQDPRVRRALALALDREGLARDVLRGGETGSLSFVPAGIPGYQPAPQAAPDAEAARALLAAAGFPAGAGLRPLELLYPHNQVTRDLCEAAATRWREQLGLRVHLVNQSWKVYLDSQRQGLYDLSWSTWIADYLEPGSFLEVFTSFSGNNRTGWADDAYDALVRQATAEPDAARRAQLYRQAEARLLQAMPIAPVYQRVNLNLVSPRVQGFFDNLLDVHPLRDLVVLDGPP